MATYDSIAVDIAVGGCSAEFQAMGSVDVCEVLYIPNRDEILRLQFFLPDEDHHICAASNVPCPVEAYREVQGLLYGARFVVIVSIHNNPSLKDHGAVCVTGFIPAYRKPVWSSFQTVEVPRNPSTSTSQLTMICFLMACSISFLRCACRFLGVF